MRRARDGGNFVIAVANCTPVLREHYRVGVPEPGVYREILNTDSERYSGSNKGNFGEIHAQALPWGNQPYSLDLLLPPLGVLYLKRG